jgi:hypothetical protein
VNRAIDACWIRRCHSMSKVSTCEDAPRGACDDPVDRAEIATTEGQVAELAWPDPGRGVAVRRQPGRRRFEFGGQSVTAGKNGGVGARESRGCIALELRGPPLGHQGAIRSERA